MKKSQLVLISNLLLIAVVIAIGVLVYTTYLIGLDSNPPVEFLNVPFPVSQTEYQHGDTVVVNIESCRYTNVPFTAHMSFVDGILYATPPITMSGTSVGCQSYAASIIVIPDALPYGNYKIIGRNEYKVNIISTRIVEWETQWFDVVP